MAKLILYYAHPGQPYSQANREMQAVAQTVDGITRVDLYAEYPRFNIDVQREQKRLLDHDVILFQFPVFWYSSPAIFKEWQDLVLAHGFAYGTGGDALTGKQMMLALTTAGPAEAYTPQGYQHHTLRTFLTPFEQTARLCKMHFPAPFVLYGALKAAAAGDIPPHASAYGKLLTAIRDDRFDIVAAQSADTITAADLPRFLEAS